MAHANFLVEFEFVLFSVPTTLVFGNILFTGQIQSGFAVPRMVPHQIYASSRLRKMSPLHAVWTGMHRAASAPPPVQVSWTQWNSEMTTEVVGYVA